MSEPFDDRTEERLRSILQTEADSVEPSPEALNLIRARTERNRFSLSWLRPLLAVGAAAAIAGSVLIGAPQVREQVLPELFPASDNKQDSPAEEKDDGGQAVGEPSTDPTTNATDPVDDPANEGASSPETGEDTNDHTSSDGSDMSMACASPPDQQTLSNNDEDDSDGVECAPGEGGSGDGSDGGDNGSGTGNGGDGGTGNGDGNGGDDGTETGDGDDEPSTPPQE